MCVCVCLWRWLRDNVFVCATWRNNFFFFFLHNTFSYSKFSKIYDSYSKFSRERLAGKFKRKFTHFLSKIHSQKNTQSTQENASEISTKYSYFFLFKKYLTNFFCFRFLREFIFEILKTLLRVVFGARHRDLSFVLSKHFHRSSRGKTKGKTIRNWKFEQFSHSQAWATSEWARCSGRQSHRSVRPRVLMVCACGAQWVSVWPCVSTFHFVSSSWKLLFFIWGKSCQWSLRRFHVKTYWNFELKTRIPPKNKQTKKIYIFSNDWNWNFKKKKNKTKRKTWKLSLHFVILQFCWLKKSWKKRRVVSNTKI